MSTFNATLHLIRELIQDGYGREQIFVLLYSESTLTNQEISDWFQKFDKDPLDESLRNNYFERLVLIADEFLSRKSIISVWPYFRRPNRQDFLDGRYSIGYIIENSTVTKLVVSDCFHGLEREIPIPDSDISEQHYVSRSTMRPVDFSYVLFYEIHFYRRTTRIFLVELDFDSGQCSIVDRQFVQGTYIGLIFDSTNRRNFAIGYTQNNPTDNSSINMIVQKAKIENSRLQIDQTLFTGPLEISRYCYTQLLNDKLYGFTTSRPERNEMQFYEVNFDVNAKTMTTTQLLEWKAEEGGVDYNKCLDKYFCVGPVWYTIEQLEGTGSPSERVYSFTVCKFDMNVGFFTKTGAFGFGHVAKIHVDENEIATIRVGAKVGKEDEELHRFALGQPDSLQISTLLSICRQVIFSGNDDKFGKQLEKLPPRLQPSSAYSKPTKEKNRTAQRTVEL